MLIEIQSKCAIWAFALLMMADKMAATLPDGKLAATLDQYHVSVKCMANIVEHYLPELNAFMICCGFWNFHDFLIYLVDSSCEPASLEQLQHLNGLFIPFIRQQCDRQGYEQGSSACQSMFLVPLIITILLIFFILTFCVCSCMSFRKMLTLRRDFRRVNLSLAAIDGGLLPMASAPMEGGDVGPEIAKRKLSKTSNQI